MSKKYDDFKKKDDTTTTRSIRVVSNQWELFGNVCEKKGTNRSEIIRDFIEYYINKEK